MKRDCDRGAVTLSTQITTYGEEWHTSDKASWNRRAIMFASPPLTRAPCSRPDAMADLILQAATVVN